MSASNVVQLPTTSVEQVEKATADDLPCPYSPEQLKAMCAEVKLAYERLEKRGEGNNFPEIVADVVYIVGKWSARAGRLYAYRHVVAAREDFADVQEKLVGEIRSQLEQIQALQQRCDMLEQLISPTRH